MAFSSWEICQSSFCDHVDLEVNLEALMVFPAEWLPDQPARVTGHRCSHGLTCNQFSKPACIWAGTNPFYDPFQT